MKIYEHKKTKKRVASEKTLAKEHWKFIKETVKNKVIDNKMKSNKIIK